MSTNTKETKMSAKTAAKKAPAKKSAAKKTPAKQTAEQVKPAESKAPVGKARATVLGYSATSVLKWMGKQGWDIDAARKAFAKLASGEVAPATISTGLSDGRSDKYSKGAAELSTDEAKQLKAAAK